MASDDYRWRDPNNDKASDWGCLFGLTLIVFIIMVERNAPGITVQTVIDLFEKVKGF